MATVVSTETRHTSIQKAIIMIDHVGGKKSNGEIKEKRLSRGFEEGGEPCKSMDPCFPSRQHPGGQWAVGSGQKAEGFMKADHPWTRLDRVGPGLLEGKARVSPPSAAATDGGPALFFVLVKYTTHPTTAANTQETSH